jgi:hypothetical protein
VRTPGPISWFVAVPIAVIFFLGSLWALLAVLRVIPAP